MVDLWTILVPTLNQYTWTYFEFETNLTKIFEKVLEFDPIITVSKTIIAFVCQINFKDNILIFDKTIMKFT